MTAADTSYLASSCLEKVLEHRFIAELTSALWLRGISDFEVLRSEVDSHGYDVLIEASGVLRHIQLKAMARGGKRRDVSVNLRLAAKPSGCVVWLVYNPDTLALGPYYWFGGEPGRALPETGTRAARHARANADGFKSERPLHRVVARTQFRAVPYLGELVDLLFGPVAVREGDDAAGAHALDHLRRHIAGAVIPDRPPWLAAVRDGDFNAIPEILNWESSVEFAHLIEGYEMVDRLGLGNPFAYADRQLAAAQKHGQWSGDAAELWVSLFLEHRRWRMAPIDPDPAMIALLDRLCKQLRDALATS